LNFTYTYNGYVVNINDSCTTIYKGNMRVDFPTEDEAIEFIDEYEEVEE